MGLNIADILSMLDDGNQTSQSTQKEYDTGDPNTTFSPDVSNSASGSKGYLQSRSSGGSDTFGIQQNAMGISSIVNSTIAYQMHKNYAKLLEQQKLAIPGAITEAETGTRQLSRIGLPGMEKYRSMLMESMPTLMAQAEQLTKDNPNALLTTLNNSYNSVTKQMEQLGLADANAHLKNQFALMHFLSAVKAPYEDAIQKFNIQKTLAAAQERMAGDKEAMQGAQNATFDITGAVNSIIGAAGAGA